MLSAHRSQLLNVTLCNGPLHPAIDPKLHTEYIEYEAIKQN